MLVIVDRLTRALALYLGGLILFILMGMTVLDVVFRYVLNAPIGGSQDISIVLLVVIVACSIAYGARTGAHVSVDLFGHLFGPTFARVSDILVRIFAAGVTAVWSWQLFRSGRVATQLEEGTLLLAIPFEPFYQVLAIGVWLYAIVLVLESMMLMRHAVVPELADESRGAEPPR
jgi:TRAP-type C4-dicarboxylate transport system permease small subunit